MKIKKRVFQKDVPVQEFENGLHIVDDNGKTLFTISQEDDVTIRIDGGETNFINGVVYTGNFRVQPLAYNCVHIIKNKHDK